MPDNCPHHHLYLITSIHPVSGSHFVSAFSYYCYPVVVCSSSPSLALALIICPYYFFFCPRLCPPFRCVYFLSDLSSFSFVYIPFSTLCSPNPVLSYLHPFTELLIERTFSPFSTPFFIPSYIYLDVNPKKISRNLG